MLFPDPGQYGEEVNNPMFFELLTMEDKQKYWEMRVILQNSEKRYKRNKRVESLQDALNAIKEFCMRGDDDDWRRCLVCGVCWMGNQEIAVNIRQLMLLVDKCKSSINGALAKMGYGTAPAKSAATMSLLQYIPYLKGNFVEQRQWTVRTKHHRSPSPSSPDDSVDQTDRTTSPGEVMPPELDDEGEATLDVEEMKPIFSNILDEDYNFITEPCCCCPTQWGREEDDLEMFFAFA